MKKDADARAMGADEGDATANLRRRRRLAEAGAGPVMAAADETAIAAAEERAQQALAALRAGGRDTARVRIEALLDPGSFAEIGELVVSQCRDFGMQERAVYGDGVVTGSGTIDGRRVFVFAQRPTVFGGSLGLSHAMKICRVMDVAMDVGAPVIGLNDSGGARIQEGVASLAGYAEIFKRNVLASGVIPQISVVLGPCAGGAVYSPALTDVVAMVDSTSYMFITGPDVIRAVTHEEVTKEDLGGAMTHARKSGVCHLVAEDEAQVMAQVREVLAFLPSNNLERAPTLSCPDSPTRETPEIGAMIPSDPSRPYDIRDVIGAIADEGSFFELHGHWAGNIVVGFARVAGRSIGVVANQPLVLAGCLDIDASVKAARFVRMCDCFNVPVMTLVDVPGFLPGTEQEYGGIIRHGAKLLYAYAEATVPKVTLVTRKAYGGAYDVMASKHLRGDANFALPGAEIAVMGAEGAVNILYRKELAAVADEAERARVRAELTAQYREVFASPYQAAELGFIDRVIEPRSVRRAVSETFALLVHKRQDNPRKKHGNIPL